MYSFIILRFLTIFLIFSGQKYLYTQYVDEGSTQSKRNLKEEVFFEKAKPNNTFLAKNGLRVQLRAKKPIYFIGEKMLMEIEIFNDSPSKSSFRFLVHDNFFQQIQFFCVDAQGHAAFPTVAYDSWRYVQNRDNFEAKSGVVADLLALRGVKEVELAYGQSFTMTVNLRDYFTFDKEGKYFVSLNFFPAPLKQSNYFFTSEEIQFNIRLGSAKNLLSDSSHSDRPSFLNDAKTKQTTKVKPFNERELRDRFARISPTFVVEKHIEAQQKKDWETFLSAFQFEELLTNSYLSTDYYERFRAAKDFEIPIIIDDFSQFLIQSIDYRILRFEPIKTLIRGDEAKVEVIVESKELHSIKKDFFNSHTGQKERDWREDEKHVLNRSRVFIYTLRRIKNVWKIVALDSRASLGEVSPDDDSLKPKKSIERVGFVYFDFNRFDLRAQYRPILKRIVDVIAAYPEIKVLLVGYADDLGPDDYNFSLSNQRVESVFQYLISHGISPERIVKDAYGEVQLEADYPAEELRQQNRRVEISLFR